MTAAAAAAYAATASAGFVAAIALWRAGAWRRARTLLAIVVLNASFDAAAMTWPQRFYTPDAFVLRESISACLGVLYALEIALGLPARARAWAVRAVYVAVLLTTVLVLVSWTHAPHTAYRVVALEAFGAAGSLAVVLFAGLAHDVEFSYVTKRALALICACYALSATALAPFETWLAAAVYAQFGAATVYVVALLLLARYSWAEVAAR